MFGAADLPRRHAVLVRVEDQWGLATRNAQTSTRKLRSQRRLTLRPERNPDEVLACAVTFFEMRPRWILALLLTLPLLADTPVSSARFYSPNHEIGVRAVIAEGLVVWETLITDATIHLFDYHFFARPIGADGLPSLPSRIPLLFRNTSDVLPAIGSNGQGYLIVCGTLGAVYGVRLDAAGNVLDSVPITIHPPTRNAFEPGETGFTFHDVAWDGANWIVTSTRQVSFSGPGSAVASIVTADGKVAPQEVAITDHAETALVAARNGVTLFAWRTPGSIEARTMSGSVTTVAPSASFDLAAVDDGFVIVSYDGSGVHTQQLDPSGRPSGFPLTISNDVVADSMTVVPHASGYDVLWFSGIEVVQAQVRRGMITTRRFAADRMASLTVVGDTPVAAWIDAQRRAVLRRLDATGDPAVLDVAVTTQSDGKIIVDGSQYFAAWNEETIDRPAGRVTDPIPSAVLTGRITSTGEHLDGSGKVLAERGGLIGLYRGRDTHLLLWADSSIHATLMSSDGRVVATNDQFPGASSAVWNGSSFLVTWKVDGRLYGMRLAPDGTLLDSTPRVVLDYQASSGVFAHGKYTFAMGYAGSVLIFVVDTELALNNVTVLSQLGFAGIATDGTRCLAAVRSGSRLAAQLIDDEGNASGPLIEIANDVTAPSALDMVWDGQTYNIAWTTGSALMLTRMTGNGELLGTSTISTAVDRTAFPFVSIAPGVVMYAKSGSTEEYKNVRRLFFEPLPPLWRRRAGGGW